MVIITKTCNISVVAIHTSLQPSICQFMIGHKHPGIFTVSDMGEYNSLNKGMELERNLSLTLSSINLEISLETHKR